MKIQLSDIGQVIQLATAPVFLLAGVGILLIVLTNRLGRIIDQMRLIEDRVIKCVDAECLAELRSLHRRSNVINIAIAASTLCGLLICVVIAMLFLGDATNLPLDHYIAVCFVGAMGALTTSFIYLMREVFLSYSLMRKQQLQALAMCAARTT
jgi:hypothetical protein